MPVTGNSNESIAIIFSDDLDHGGDNYARERPADAADHEFDLRGPSLRAFLLPPSMLKDLRRGTPGMGLALTKALVFEEDPDVLVQLGEETDEPPKLSVTITSDSVHEELKIDDVSTLAEVVGIAIMIADMIGVLKRDYPDAVRGLDLIGLVRDLLDEERGRPS